MSRCFPFPPPGYEKKARTEDSDLLKKEKHREKQHKKEKRESREKKEKNRSDGKHREKKDKKEKHRDKKKEKEKDKDKYRNNNSDEKRVPGRSEGHDVEKTVDEKKLPGKSVGHTPENFIQKENARDQDRSGVSGEKKPAGQFSGCNRERLSQNNYLAEESKDYIFIQELGRRVRDEDRGTGSQLVENLTIANRKMDEGMVRLVAKTIGPSTGGKEKNNDKTGDDRKLDGQGTRDEARFGGNAMVQNLAGISQTRVEGIPRKLEKDVKKVEGKEKTKEKEGDEARFSGNALVQTLGGISQTRVEGIPRKLEKDVERMVERKEKTKEKEGDDKRGDKRKDKNREKKGQGKDKDRDKEKKKEEKAKEKSEKKKREQDKLKENKDDLIGSHNIKTSHLSMESNKSVLTDENIRKRKDIEANGFLRVNDIRPNKLPRSHSSHPLPENGKILEAGQTSSLSTSDRLGTANNLKVENKDRKVNGMVEAQSFPVCSTKPYVTSAQGGQIAEVSMKPPHPDSKYLIEVLSVPKMEEWSDFDDQDWLFHNSESQSKKPKVGCSKVDETSQVWAESLRIESADIIALPYVIPY